MGSLFSPKTGPSSEEKEIMRRKEKMQRLEQKQAQKEDIKAKRLLASQTRVKQSPGTFRNTQNISEKRPTVTGTRNA